MRPGYCNGKAHKPEHLGYAGRRVLVSRKWSGKTLADHKHDRRAWVLSMLGVDPDDPAQTQHYSWEYVGSGDPDVPSLQHRLLRAVAGPVPLARPTRRRQSESRRSTTTRQFFGNRGGGGVTRRSTIRTRDELLTVEQVLDELGGVARRTFYRWRELGNAPQGLRLPNGEIRIWRSEFAEWLESLRETA